MNCPSLMGASGSAIANGLRAVDCVAGQATETAFARIFGGSGALTGALTIALTLYIALLAIGLLSGRSTLSLSTLTPRVMLLGLVLTFATSWAAYQSVIWTLLSGGPDQIAGILLKTRGSASIAFAQRLDVLFNAVAEAAAQAHAAQGDAKGTTPDDLLSWSALLLLLGTVGVLVTSRIALAALLAVGPVFLVMALFSGTRGLFEGWIKAAVMFALVPLFTVLIGAGAVAMLEPVVAELGGGEVDMELAVTVFMAAVVHCALMVMVLKLVGNLTSGWRIGFGDRRADTAASANNQPPSSLPSAAAAQGSGAMTIAAAGAAPPFDDRIRAIVAASHTPASQSAGLGATIVPFPGATAANNPAGSQQSATGDIRSRASAVGRSLLAPAPGQPIREIAK